MTEAIFDALGAVLTRWTMGTPAASAPPSAWRDAIGGEPRETELRLLALSGQFLGTAVVAEPQGELHTQPDVPALALPALPDALRSLARRLHRMMKEAGQQNDLLYFLAARGWTMHPDDWMPSVGDEEAPEVYAPWRDWAQDVVSGRTVGKRADGELTAENWDDYRAAQRAAALAALRRRDPDAARALLEGRFASEAAEVRLRLLHVLAEQLSEWDAPFLEGIAAADRAPKVKGLAVSLLARLGRGPAAGENISELAGFFELSSKGLLRRSRVVAPRAIKSQAQSERRSELFADAGFAAFAGALGLAPAELVEAWSWEADLLADRDLAATASRSATDDIVVAIVDALSKHSQGSDPALRALMPRLDAARRTELVQQVLHGGGSFRDALTLGGVVCRIADPINTPAGVAFLTALANTSPRDQPKDPVDQLRALGLIASRAGAARAVERLVAASLLHSHPLLDMLRLNAALDDKGEQ